jgi:hypothetical protein
MHPFMRLWFGKIQVHPEQSIAVIVFIDFRPRKFAASALAIQKIRTDQAI